jgi:glyoxylase-like metal-dependent hydrolase (beta-lactamase superfamily II)
MAQGAGHSRKLTARTEQPMSEYEILAVRSAHNAERRTSENFLSGDPHDGLMPMDFFVWVLKGSGQAIIVDTGFDADMAKRRARNLTRPVADCLKAAGVDLAGVKDVVLTHMHYDHAGNHDIFPNARHQIQDREMEYCTGRCMCHSTLRHPFEADDVTAMVRKLFQGRVQFHNGASEIADGVTVHLVGGHSRGLQFVRVRTRRGWVVLASDASHYYANFEQYRPFPVVVDVSETLEGYDAMRRLASSQSHIVPGHDPLVLQRYPAQPGGPADIIRLDAEPLK